MDRLTRTPEASQATALGWLADPATFGVDEPVEVVETHGAYIFLTREHAWKVKRAVHYDYLDQSTLSRRRAFLERELELNKRTAPEIYQAVVPLDYQGRIDGSGTPIEWILRMRRFPADYELSTMAARNGLTDTLAMRIGHEIAAFHAECPILHEDGAILMREIVDELGRVLPELVRHLGSDAVDFPDRARNALSTIAPLLSDRGAAGLVRRGHGDLHLSNLVLLDGRPTPFDALEFDERLGTCDVLYDLAFLLMDMRHKAHDRAACLTMNAWLADFTPPQETGLAAMPLFLSIRAAILAMVEAQTAAVADRAAIHAGEGRRYLADAFAYMRPGRPRLVAIGGLSGSGKSTLVKAVAHTVTPPPGAVILRSDLIRKAQAGVAPTERLPDDAYSAQTASDVYAEMRNRARNALRAGMSVILDAVHLRPEERHAAEALGKAEKVPFQAVWIDAPDAILRARIAVRANDASDADQSVLENQLDRLGQVEWPKVANAGSVADGTRRLIGHLSASDA